MTSFLKRLFLPAGQESQSSEMQASFGDRYDNIQVGILFYKDGVWRFKYTEAFKNQLAVNPISDFPDTSKEYSSELLRKFGRHTISNPYQLVPID